MEDDGDGDVPDRVGEEVDTLTPPGSPSSFAEDEVAAASIPSVSAAQFEKVRVSLDPQTPFSATITIQDEDHTLGNILRYFLMRRRDVILAAYTIPHPLESALVIRVQTVESIPALDAVKSALRDMIDVCDVMKTRIQKEVDHFIAAR